MRNTMKQLIFGVPIFALVILTFGMTAAHASDGLNPLITPQTTQNFYGTTPDLPFTALVATAETEPVAPTPGCDQMITQTNSRLLEPDGDGVKVAAATNTLIDTVTALEFERSAKAPVFLDNT